MRRLFIGCLLIGLLAGVGCSSAPIDYKQAKADQPGTTFLILGLWNVFSKGLLDVTDQLEDEGYYARTISGSQWRDIGDRIIMADRAGELRRPLVLGGHSLGADKSLKLSAKLEEAGIAVDYVLLLDATNPREVPANVKRCHNIYLSHPATDWIPAFRGIPVKAINPQTELINFNVRSADTGPLSNIDFNHFDIESDPDIQALMVELIDAQLTSNPDIAAIFPAKIETQSN